MSKSKKKAAKKGGMATKKATKKPVEKKVPKAAVANIEEVVVDETENPKSAADKGEAAERVPRKRTQEPAADPAEFQQLHKQVAEEKRRLDAVEKKTMETFEKAKDELTEARDNYMQVLAPYREACRKNGVECEFAGGRSANKTEAVRFLVEKTEKGVRIAIKGRPDTEEVVPLKDLRESPNRVAYAYTEKHLGPKQEIGNKGGGLGNRLRAVINA